MTWARELAAELLSHYPGAFITEANLDAIAADLERAETEARASDVVALLRLRCKTVPNGADIAETIREVRHETMSPREELGYVPTETMSADIWAHGRYHLAELLDTPKEQRTDEMRQRARYPQTCGCDKRAEPTLKKTLVP